MRNSQFICHNLVYMLTMCLKDILFQYYPMYYSKHRIHTINTQKYNIPKISGFNNQFTQQKHYQKCYSNLP